MTLRQQIEQLPGQLVQEAHATRVYISRDDVLALLSEAAPAPPDALWRGFAAGFHARRIYANFAPPRWEFSPCTATVDEAYAAFLATGPEAVPEPDRQALARQEPR